jgi:lipopolysaccharide transport system ATP-binding protein
MTSACPIELDHIGKQYQLGSKHDSLRDAIPNLLQRLRRRAAPQEHSPGSFWALKDISFTVPKGQTLGLIGPNGAGKSTILKLLSRICKQTTGTMQVHGRLAALIEVGAGFHPDLTGRENIFMNGTIMGLSRKDIRRLFDAIVAFSELEKFLEMPGKRYSSGMSVRLGFAVAAHVNPDILLIDEVLAVGDLAFQQKCYQRILELKAKGTTMLFVSHNLDAVRRICDRVVLLREGRVVMDGDPDAAIAAYHKDTFRKFRYETVLTPHGNELSDTSKDAEFVQVQVLNAEGRPQETIEAGQPFQVSLTFRTKRPIPGPSVTVAIERIDGQICHEASTEESKLYWDRWEGEGRIVLEYPTPNLRPNAYLISAVMYERHNPAGVARMPGPIYFHITSDRVSRGLVDLSHRWTVELPKGIEHVRDCGVLES